MSEQQNLTVAQIFFKDHQILAKRPEGMEFKEYWFLRYMQNQLMKRMFSGSPDRKLVGIIPGAAIYKTRIRK